MTKDVLKNKHSIHSRLLRRLEFFFFLWCRVELSFFPHYIYHVVDHESCQKKDIWSLGICQTWSFWENIFGYDCQCGPTKYLTIHMCGGCKLFATPPDDFVNWCPFWDNPRPPVRKKVWPIFWVGFGKSTLRGHPSQGGSLSSSSSGVEAIMSEYSSALPMLAPFSNSPRWHHNDVYGVGYDSRFVVGYMGLLYPSSTQLV